MESLIKSHGSKPPDGDFMWRFPTEKHRIRLKGASQVAPKLGLRPGLEQHLKLLLLGISADGMDFDLQNVEDLNPSPMEVL